MVILMSLIVVSVLSVSGYAVTYISSQRNMMLTADADGGYMSANDGAVAYTTEFTYGQSYAGSTPTWLTGYVSVEPNTDRGSTAGGDLLLTVDEKNLFFWLNHSSITATSKNITIENVSYTKTYTIESNKMGSCAYTTGKTYRGRFQVSTLCGGTDAHKVKVHPAMNFTIYMD